MTCRIPSHCVLLAALCLSLISPLSGQDIPNESTWQSIPDSSMSYTIWVEGSTTYYAVKGEGDKILLSRPLDPTLRLRAGAFVPLETAPPSVNDMLKATTANRLWLVQYAIPGVPQFRQALANAGAEVLQFMPESSDLVRMDSQTVKQIRRLPFVNWVGAYHPGWRVDEATRDLLLSGNLVTAKYNMLVTKAGGSEKAQLASTIASAGGQAEELISEGRLMSATLSPAALLRVLRSNVLLFIDPWSPLEEDVDKARVVGGADFLESAAGFTGTGVRGEVMDGGLRASHLNYNNPIIHGSNNTGNAGHGTPVFGIVFGTGNHDATARGILPDGTGIFSSSGGIVGNPAARYPHTQQILQPPYEGVFQTNSTGSARTFFYTTISSSMDTMLFDLDFVILQSQSNAGNQDSRPQAWAKNMVSIGGVRHYDTVTTADDAWAGGGSIGPAQDGRIKPDMSFFYDATRSTSSTSDTSYTNSFGGTSGATPLTAGHIGLLHQMWFNGVFGNTVPSGSTVFSARPHMTTAKALLINTGAQYSFTGTGDDLTRVHQGWGRASVENAWNKRNRMFIVNEDDVLAPFQSTRYVMNVTAADPELKVTMIFADPAGSPSASESRINDLTLRVTDPNGVVYWGNNGLLANNYSTPGGTPNGVDTVENVFVNNPTPGQWTVDVMAFEINQDSHVETGAVDADYALVVSGANEVGATGSSTGQANSLDASLNILGAFNLGNQSPAIGTNGPFTADVGSGLPIALSFAGQPMQPFLLANGPLNANNASFPGVGSLDIGFLGGANFADIAFIMNGFTPATFFDSLATLDANGAQTLSFTPPTSLSGMSLGGMQALMQSSTGIVLSAAIEINVN